MSNLTLVASLVALLGALMSLGVLLVVLQRASFGRRDDAGERQALLDVRQRIDVLIDAQRDMPRQMAEDTAIQARSLADVRERLVQVTEAAHRLEHIGTAVGELHALLRVPKLRGQMGELWLEEALRNVLPVSAFHTDYAFRSGERVDAVIRLQDKLVPIDAKFPMEAYQRMRRETGADAARERRAFHRSVRARIDEIAEKYIRPDEGTFEFALMYIPAEGVYYDAAVRDDRDGDGLTAYAQARNVFLVSPNTLYAYLSALAHGLRGLEVQHHSREILGALGGLRQAVGGLRDAAGLLGRHLGNAVKQHDEVIRALDALAVRLDGITTPPGPTPAGKEDA